MDRSALPEALNGGYIEDYELDLTQNLLSMRVEVLDNGRLSSHELRFERLSRFEVESNSRMKAGDRLQLTELWIDSGPEASGTEEWSATLSIWDTIHVRLRCSVIRVNGEVLR